VTESDFLLSKTDSRAELKYPDGSIVRVGQNTVFSFDAKSRTLTLEKGRFIFYIPENAGGCMIKTPSYTAAITGCKGTVTTSTLYLDKGKADFDDGKSIGSKQYYNAVTKVGGSGTLTGGKLDQPPLPGGSSTTGDEIVSLLGAYPDLDKPGITGPSNPFNSPNQVVKRNPATIKIPPVKKKPKVEPPPPPPPPPPPSKPRGEP
jgi:hypothetical protein